MAPTKYIKETKSPERRQKGPLSLNIALMQSDQQLANDKVQQDCLSKNEMRR